MNDAKLVGYVAASKYRKKTLNYLNTKSNTPMNIAEGTGIRRNHISKTLNELSRKKLVKCLNPEMRKGKIYEITEKGKKINKDVKKFGGS